MADAKLQVVMGLRDEISEKLTGIGGKIQGMSGQLKKAGMIMTGAGAAITASLGLATKAALDEQIGINQLDIAIKNAVPAKLEFAKASDALAVTEKRVADAEEALSALRASGKATTEQLNLAEIEYGIALGQNKRAIDDSIEAQKKIDEQIAVGTFNYATHREEIEKVISALQAKTSYGDGPQREALSQLIAITGDYETSLQALPVVMDMASSLGMDLTSTSLLLGKALAGETSSLSRYGIQLAEGASKTEILTKLTSQFGGSAEAMADPLAMLKNSLGDVAEDIGKNLLPILKSVVNAIIPVLSGIMDWMKANPGLAKTLVIVVAAIGGIMTVVGPLLIALPFLVTGIGTVSAAFAVLSASGGPIFLVVAAIAALIAIGVLVWKNWDTISEKATQIWGAIKDFFINIWETIISVFKEHWDKILAILFPAVGIPILIARHWGEIVEKVKEIFESVKEKVKMAFEAVVSFVKENWDKILAVIFPAVGLPILIARNWGAIVDEVKSIWEKVKSVFKEGINFLIGLAEGWANMYVKAVNTIIGALNKIQVSIPDWVPGIGGKGWGIDLPMAPEVSLPRLAQGGIVTRPTLALLGERGPEAVVPLGKGVININFNAPVYGFDDFRRKVAQAVRDTKLAGGLSGI